MEAGNPRHERCHAEAGELGFARRPASEGRRVGPRRGERECGGAEAGEPWQDHGGAETSAEADERGGGPHRGECARMRQCKGQ